MHKLKCSLILLVLFYAHVTLNLVLCEVYYIVPSQSSFCSFEESCLTLSQFADKSYSDVDSNITLLLVEGSHDLDKEISLSNVTIFSMVSTNDSSFISDITCSSHPARFIFSYVSQVYIHGLEFIGCDGNRFKSVGLLTITYSRYLGQSSRTSLLTIVDSYVKMEATSFLSNTMGSHRSNLTFLSYLQMTFEYSESVVARVGGALVVTHSTLALDNCLFEGNRAKIGGAIFSEFESNITISNSVFISNHAVDHNNKPCFGGALFFDGTGSASMVINNSTFHNNTSTQYGGMAVVFNATYLTISRGYAFKNTAAKYGGVVAVFQSDTLMFEVTKFSNNKANCDGGAVYLHKSSVTVRDCDFSYNEANRMGGAIASNTSSSITLISSQFTYNSAGTGGGVMSTLQSSAALIDNGTLLHNTAFGGGVVHAQDHSTVSINVSTFVNNSATSDGGVLFIRRYSSVTVGSSSVAGSKVYSMGGFAFLFENSTIAIDSSTFSHNQAEKDGGVINAQNQSSVTICSSNFSYNVGNIYGGVVHVMDGCSVLVIGCTFAHNIAQHGGVFNGYSQSSINIYRSTFADNTANNTGGVLISKLDSNSFIEESQFSNNIARDAGAVVYAEKETATVIQKCLFANNSAIYGGVLVALRKGTVTVSNSTVNHNIANIDGGFIYTRMKCKVIVSNSSFINNTANNDGIMLASDSGSFVLDNSNFSDNVAGHDGGVVYVYNNSTAVINGCNFTGNRANNSGGVVYVRKHSTITVNNSNIHNSTAESSGGAVSAQSDCNVTVEASNLSGNTADYGGVVRLYIRSTINITNSKFSKNKANIGGGIIATYKYSTVIVQTSDFIFNQASFGGVLIAYWMSRVKFQDDCFLNNTAKSGGVVRILQRSAVTIDGSTFGYNAAELGGVLYVQGGFVTIESSSFDHNSAGHIGGVVYADDGSAVSVNIALFSNNVAEGSGGAVALRDSNITIIKSSSFSRNRALGNGGVISQQNSNVSIVNSTFNLSTAGDSGGVVYAVNSSTDITVSVFIDSNAAKKGGAVDAQMGCILMALNCSFIRSAANNSTGGALYLSESSKGIIVDSIFHHNRAKDCGGAISASATSRVSITGSNFSHNTADMGAALAAVQDSFVYFDSVLFSENKVIADGETRIHKNVAKIAGGGIFLSESLLGSKIKTNISYNKACNLGGGIHALNSSIMIGSTVHIDSNQATSGGGVSLENSKLYELVNGDILSDVNFIFNQADYGGALYVDDESDSAVCSSDPYGGGSVYSTVSGCFFQNVTDGLLINFNDNYANVSGHSLFGGLLDRCTVVSDTNSSKMEPSGAARIQEISNIRIFDAVSSEPVRVCLCKSNEPDCSQKTLSIQVKQGNKFIIPLAAVDQVNQTVTATIQSNFKDLTLPKNQTVRRVDSNCSDLDYQVIFPSVSEEYKLTIYAEGPCSSAGISNLTVSVYALRCSCAPGFMQEHVNTKCSCICDKRDEIFSKYISECNSTTMTVIRKGEFWITYLNDSDNDSSSPYFIYPYCPLDYCQSPGESVHINLNLPNGEDAQCANNRGGLLCGSCQCNYSLSLGSTKCIKCPDKWYRLLVGVIIAALFAGIVLVILLLVLNLTVAIGTLNSIIFYANIIYANKSTFFSHRRLNLTFIPVFVSWLNLDVGFDVCFFEGMDVYAKTWLQLAFPVYIIFLVIMITWISSCSSRLSNLIGKKNPVATLATLILLSYTKLLETVIKSFSHVNLKYPNGTTTTRWLSDASVEYKEWKLIILVCVAILILFLGLLYTILILSWQWLLHCPRSNIFKWTRNHKLHSFIDTYHTPHTAKHRYWTGLLLLVRVLVYLISAFSVSIDPRITLLSTAVIMCCLLLYKTMFIIRVYRNWLLNAMESFVYFNIAVFAIFTWYAFDDLINKSKGLLQSIATYISVGTTFFLFLLVIVFHAYRYSSTRVYSLAQSTKLVKKLKEQMSYNHNRTSSDGGIYRLLDIIDNPRDDVDGGYTPPSLQLHEGPTSSVVSLENCDESLTSESSPNNTVDVTLNSTPQL